MQEPIHSRTIECPACGAWCDAWIQLAEQRPPLTRLIAGAVMRRIISRTSSHYARLLSLDKSFDDVTGDDSDGAFSHTKIHT